MLDEAVVTAVMIEVIGTAVMIEVVITAMIIVFAIHRHTKFRISKLWATLTVCI